MATFGNGESFLLAGRINTGLRLGLTAALTTTAFFCGKTFSQSFSTTPALLEAPAPLLAKQWKKMFDSDKALAPAVALLGTSVFGYMVYIEHIKTSSTALLYTTSTFCLLWSVPYTILLMEPINRKLEKKALDLASVSVTDAAAEADIAKEETVHVLVDRWATVNLGRTILTGIAAIAATWASVDKFAVNIYNVTPRMDSLVS